MNFVNPYNFIPFSEETPRKKRDEASSNLTGVIEYSLLTKTPLFIPNTSNDDVLCLRTETKELHKSFDFFSYKDLSNIKQKKGDKPPENPVIPGSEIRGMFRANYEILTDSCLPFVESDQILHKRIAGARKAGLLEKTEEGYVLWKAKDWLLRTKGKDSLDTSDQDYNKKNKDNKYKYRRESYIQSALKEGSEISFKEIEIGTKKNKRRGKPLAEILQIEESKKVGYLIKGMPGPAGPDNNGEAQPDNNREAQHKHCAHIFENQGTKVLEKKLNPEIHQLDETLQVYQNNNDAAYYSEYKAEWENFKKGDEKKLFPVYYSYEEGLLYLSPACITLETYNKRIGEFVGEKKHACTDKANLCLACRLFGMMNPKSTNVAVTSRIRFGDLNCTKEKPAFKDWRTLENLASPKLQNTEFYLRRPSDEAQFWTYEYWIDKKGVLHKQTALLNGRKFYWHSNKVADASSEKTSCNMTIRPLSEGVTFKGKLYFKNITQEELNQLIWLLNCGDFKTLEDKKHGYKLGAAKPLGYGSVAVSVDTVILRKLNIKEKEIQYCNKIYNAGEQQKSEVTKCFQNENFEKMTRFSYVQDTVDEETKISYPSLVGESEVYKWFVNNHVNHRQQQTGKEELISDKMVQQRSQMAVMQYMEPMSPMLKKINYNCKIDLAKEKGNAPKNKTSPKTKTTMEGEIKFYDKNEKYGYIISQGKDYYYRESDVLFDLKELKKGIRVEFEKKETNKGDNAIDIRLKNNKGANR